MIPSYFIPKKWLTETVTSPVEVPPGFGRGEVLFWF